MYWAGEPLTAGTSSRTSSTGRFVDFRYVKVSKYSHHGARAAAEGLSHMHVVRSAVLSLGEWVKPGMAAESIGRQVACWQV
jgi:hypothetical protein